MKDVNKMSEREMRQEILELRKLVKMGEAVVEDFLPNIGNCALQDIGRLNLFLMNASTLEQQVETPSELQIVETDEDLPCSIAPEDRDEFETSFNMREWVCGALEAKGAKMTGGGFGLGGSDLDIDVEGMSYNIKIRPI